MKLHMKGVCALIGTLALANSALATHTNHHAAPAAMPAPITMSMPGKVYLGIFGGGGASDDFNAKQYGTAFYLEADGGPLAVNAFGNLKSQSTGFGGGQIGYQAPGVLLNTTSDWAIAPAVEVEGFYMGKSSFSGSLSNDTTRLDEHNFDVTYPMKKTVFLTNLVFTLDQPCLLLHPYVGVGIGGALVNISGADALQVDPVEDGVNHYNANPSDKDVAFAGQVKVGLSYDLTSTINVFAEYRWLYLSSTHFDFGSTVYPELEHPATSSWTVNVDPQSYNLGSIGLRVNL